MIWRIVYLAVFLGGLALAVHAMLLGVERWRRRRSTRPSPVFNPPTAAALGMGFGVTGYLLTTRSDLGWPWILLLSILIGGAALAGMIVLMAKWALREPLDHADADEDIYGQTAVVTRTITAASPGEITYTAFDKTHTLEARSVNDAMIPENTEVVIEAIDDGIALVELWSVVEQRL
ncbi:MAG TPA: NfeD family protein [Gemmatimonadaceae bacterium]|nr:NfeD family protein [Gemmatimonadaceae bacterium]